MRSRSLVATMTLFTLLGPSLFAHDLWIEPTAYTPAVGAIVGIKLKVGEHFLGDPVPRDPALIEQFVSVDSGGRRPVVGQDGMDPAGLLRVTTPGLIIAGYRSRPYPVTLNAGKFNQYLKEEGLDAVIAARARKGQTDADAREIFSRHAKSLVLAGSPDAGADKALGFTLELVAERNPYAIAPGDELPVRLTYQGQPLANALVVAMPRTNPVAAIKVRTGKDGRVRLRLAESGAWLVKAVHMIPAPPASGAEWESFWASLTFELGSPRASR